jgi:hypothetical protein
MAFSKSTIIKWAGSLMVIAAAAATAFATGLPSTDAVKGCLGAITVCGFAGCVALIPIFYAVSRRPDLTQILSIAATGIRLLLTFAGSVTICLFASVNVLWFIGWIAVFYLVILVIEVRIAIGAADSVKLTGIHKRD